jgi:transposase
LTPGGHRRRSAAIIRYLAAEGLRPLLRVRLLRSIDRFVDLSGIREALRPFYNAIGRPSIDPELMIRTLLVGYCFGIRSWVADT